MDQSITLKIGGSVYPMAVSSPEKEEAYRIAADEINKLLATYEARFPDRSLSDKLVFVSLQLAVNKLLSKNSARNLKAEIDDIQKDLEAYLEGK